MTTGQTVLYGVIWAAITGAVGWFGMSLTDNGGFASLVGWALGIGGYAFAGMAIWHVVRTVAIQRRGMQMIREDPEGFAALAHQYQQANDRLEQLDGELVLVSQDEFMVKTMGGRPNRMDTSIYDGHPFDCACGDTHIFSTASVPIMRELAGMKLVLACPNGEGITCVKVTGGMLRFKGFRSLFGAGVSSGSA